MATERGDQGNVVHGLDILTVHCPQVVIIKGAGLKAFCAGGDVKSLYDAKRTPKSPADAQVLDTFFREEFTLDYSLARMRPVQVSLLDGIVMGGGVGISVHSKVRVATENSVFAMPEARIGFFTDVGGGYFLSRLRKNLGLFLGLTGARLRGKELVQIGLADFFVKRENIPKLEESLFQNASSATGLDQVHEIVKPFNEPVEQRYEREDMINELFESKSLSGVFENLKTYEKDKEFAASNLKLLGQQCPLSLRIIYEQIKRARTLDLAEAFRSDFRLAQRFMEGNDFFEGVKSVLVDKNHVPIWTHKTPEDVPVQEVERFFSRLPEDHELKIQRKPFADFVCQSVMRK
eukprot:TRINITY_DN8474_c0_g1_i7.p1 TRINITY_DN8474_c0_g1~~TRINITY_DN8474_c0_g1_i7.p1  ORF type:complete len:348 (-),score=97.80 TRINITY_DN8474_c0_g1_i7:292-1335(-)